MIVTGITVGLLQENCYIFGCQETGKGVIIDPGDEARSILSVVRSSGLQIEKILNTHAHFDHVMAVNAVKKVTKATFHLHEYELPVLEAAQTQAEMWLSMEIDEVTKPDAFLTHGQVIPVGNRSLHVRFVPGHAPGHVVFIDHEARLVFAGDTLFEGSIGRFDLPGADGPTLLRAIQSELMVLSDDYQVLPGHGAPTTIGAEREGNPFVGRQAQFTI